MYKNFAVRCLFVFLFVFFAGAGNIAHTEAAETILKQDTMAVYKGDSFELKEYINEEYREKYVASLADKTPDKTIAQVENNIITAKNPGTIYVDVRTKDGEKTETIEIVIEDSETINGDYGTSVKFAAADVYSESDVTYTIESSDNSLIKTAEDTVFIQGFTSGTVYGYRASTKVSFAVAKINVNMPAFASNKIIIAKNEILALSSMIVLNKPQGTTLEWEVEKVNEKTIATVKDDKLTATATGTTTLKLVITAVNGMKKEISTKVIVTDPVLSKYSIVIAAGSTTSVVISGANNESSVIWDTSKDGAAYFSSEGKIYGDYAGTKTLTVTVDGRELKITVNVTDPSYSDLTIIMYKGMKKQLKLKGIDDKSSIAFSSSKKATVSITDSGLMYAKKTGHANILCYADGREIKLPVEICTKKGYKAAKKAIAISKTKTKYSQARRMSKGYYDCSSLISRVYRLYKVYFGSKKGWSPVAAAIGKWCVSHKKVVAYKGVSYKKLLPGDLVFFSDWKNGRYKNITHIEMYVGGCTNVSASSSRNKVIHYGYDRYRNIVLIARPTKGKS